MNHFSTLEEYCKGINISPPQWNDFDVRSFQKNMRTVHHQMPPFNHEFYSIAIKLDGSGYAKTGNHSTEDLKVTILFNLPYQINQWISSQNGKAIILCLPKIFNASNKAKNK